MTPSLRLEKIAEREPKVAVTAKPSSGLKLRFYDAHNHLHDERFRGQQAELLSVCARESVAGMVVNGSSEQDWPQVLALAEAAPVVAPVRIIPSLGYHPWYIHERTADWQKNLTRLLDQASCAVGEIGLDRWKPDLPYDEQEAVFTAQLQLAAERNLPVSIHCLQAWGRMFDLLKAGPRPARGFLLHSYGGPKEMVKPFTDLGAYFSLPGYYAHARKERQRETFRHIPPERLLIETDAPDQSLPDTRDRFQLRDGAGRPLNHPANLRTIYEFAAELLDQPMETIMTQVEQNFLQLFGGCCGGRAESNVIPFRA